MHTKSEREKERERERESMKSVIDKTRTVWIDVTVTYQEMNDPVPGFLTTSNSEVKANIGHRICKKKIDTIILWNTSKRGKKNKKKKQEKKNDKCKTSLLNQHTRVSQKSIKSRPQWQSSHGIWFVITHIVQNGRHVNIRENHRLKDYIYIYIYIYYSCPIYDT